MNKVSTAYIFEKTAQSYAIILKKYTTYVVKQSFKLTRSESFPNSLQKSLSSQFIISALKNE